jgi:hypothetical protein
VGARALVVALSILDLLGHLISMLREPSPEPLLEIAAAALIVFYLTRPGVERAFA